MPSNSLDRLLTRLDQVKSRFGSGDAAHAEKLLATVGRRRFRDVDSLLRFHEILLFLRAHPHNARVLRLTEQLLSSFVDRVELLRSDGADLYSLDYIENSGLSGTAITAAFSYALVSWLVSRYRSRVQIEWDRYEKTERLGSTLPRFLPLLDEDSMVEANIPYVEWLRAAVGRRRSALTWLIKRFEALPVSEKEKAELYDALELPVRWELDNLKASRTNLRRRVPHVYYHRGGLIRRSEISLEEQLNMPGIPMTRLSSESGKQILDIARQANTVRYRELYGITHSNPRTVVKADVGRGVEIFLWGLPVERRLPLRGYHAGLTLKNGVPINYIEAITLFERTELGFNTFYTFRDGESAWVYAQVLRLLNQLLGVTCISVDPYQIGLNNEEAIESGAFWFYRKLGFRPTRPELAAIMKAEERKLQARSGYRTPPRTLRRLAQDNLVFEVPGSPLGYWDRFHVRTLGLRLQRLMADRFGGDADRMRLNCIATVARELGIEDSSWNEERKKGFGNLAMVLSLIPDVRSWDSEDKRALARIIRAKVGGDELRYVRAIQRHQRLRAAINELGASDVPL